MELMENSPIAVGFLYTIPPYSSIFCRHLLRNRWELSGTGGVNCLVTVSVDMDAGQISPHIGYLPFPDILIIKIIFYQFYGMTIAGHSPIVTGNLNV